MTSDDFTMVAHTDVGPVHVAIARSALARLSGRSHATPEEIASAYRVEIEDMVRDKLLGSPKDHVRLDETDF